MRNDNLTDVEIDENLSFKSRNASNCLADTPIFRVFNPKYLLDMIQNRRNTLVHISKWDDPFEAFLLKQKVFDDQGQEVEISVLLKDFYGQCWSMNQRESDATWRIYSPDKDGVLVKTTLGKLWDTYYNPCFRFSNCSLYIGKVEYLEEKDIINNFSQIHLSHKFDSSLLEITQTLLIKRMEFCHENEIRLVYNDAANLACRGLVSYSIEPKDLIDCLVADPRMDECEFACLKKRFKALGFEIVKSQLYQLADLKLRW